MPKFKYTLKDFLVYTFSITLIFFITLFLSDILIWILYVLGLLSKKNIDNPITILIVMLASTIIFGAYTTIMLNRKMVTHVKEFMDGIDKLAKGDFNTTLYINHPPEFKILSKNFNRMAKELSSIEILRRDFINNFSHEFKTPIISIKGFAEILKDDNLSKEERDEYLDILISEADRLSKLSTNVLNLSKIETQCILSDKDKFNIGEQLRQCILLLDSKFDSKNIDLEADIIDVNYTGNKEMLNQVWINLIENAIKFTPSDGFIQIFLKKSGNSIVATISDNGVGISKEDLPKIFDKFYQADTSHSETGNGLGLTMVKKIIDLHDSSIECKSKIGIGTEFKVTLYI